MAKKQAEPQEEAKPTPVKIIGMFALLFLGVELIVAGLGLGMNLLMRTMGAGDNLKVFLGSTISRAGMIAAALLLTIPMLTTTLHKPGNQILYPRIKGWGKDLLAGLGIAAAGMAVVFALELALGWLKIDGLAFSGLPWDACLRALWLALLVNATAAVSEEVIFRGFLFTGLKESWDTTAALLVSAVIFGGVHLLANAAASTNWTKLIPMVALVGAMLAWAYLRTGSLWLPTGLHFAWNLFQDDIFNLNARTGSDTLVGLKTSLTAPGWFAGSSFGIEVGAAGLLALAITLLGVWLYTRSRAAQV
jgi:membrane protease YdiL (CAAX protease family)